MRHPLVCPAVHRRALHDGPSSDVTRTTTREGAATMADDRHDLPDEPVDGLEPAVAPDDDGALDAERAGLDQDGEAVGARRGEAKRQSTGSFLRELPVLLLIAFVLAFLLRTFVLQVFYIPSASMETTLMVNDRMVVEKVTYRFREPRRGEIVVFEGETTSVPAEETGPVASVVRGVGQFLGVVPASARDFVKRVIGLPGDEVVIVGGTVYVNGEELEEPYVQFEDTDYGPVVVPEDHLFFLGDNRPNSSDSRRSLGFVPRDAVVGRALVIIWPLDHTGFLTGVEHDVPSGDTDPPSVDEVPDAAATG
ncbi:signal peptidase I [Nitriliruptoraceae bacterium ZYF776]|nr:signal peptidase I [Profundirhabdus halotolerans]